MYSALTQLLLGSNALPTVQAHRQRLHARIGEVESELMALKMCYNSFAPINDLPAEVMSNILLLNATEVMDEYPTWHKKSMSWISSTQVCRQWRAVALNFPTLWSNVLFVHPELAECMIRLSKDAPLTVRAVVHGTEFIGAISKIFAQSHRLRALDLSGVAAPAFVSALTTPAPLLMNLALSPPPNVTMTSQPASSRDRHLHSTHLRCDTLPLRRGINSRWDQTSLPWS